MREDLLGYLLGALQPHEMRAVAQRLRDDPAARAELDQLKRMLEPLEQDTHIAEPPPPDLVARTMANLPPLPVPTPRDFESDRAISPTAEPADDCETATPLRSLSPVKEFPGRSTWTYADWFAGAAAAAILAALIVPSLVEGRFQARNRACQDNLRELGTAMTQFVTRNAQARLPSVHRSGHRAFAGVYAPHLRSAGLLNGINATLCPSWEPPEFWRASGLEFEEEVPEAVTLAMIDSAAERAAKLESEGIGSSAMRMLPSDELVRVDRPQRLGRNAVDQLRYLQTVAGGHYAYNLGVREGERFSAPRFQGRSSFAVMSDAVLEVRSIPLTDGTGDARSTSPNRSFSSMRVMSHDGRGINVLYEDGRVRFIAAGSLGRLPDHPLVNHGGRVEAGLTIDDASLAPSWQPPFVGSPQR